MKIEKYTNDAKTDSRQVELKVEYGKVRATVEQKYDGEKNSFNVKTPTAVAGVPASRRSPDSCQIDMPR